MSNKKVIKFFIAYNILVIILNLVHPVTPTLMKNINMPNYMFGILFSAMSFTLFLFSPFWGKISESIGYINVISISLTGYAVGQFMFMNSTTEFTLIVSRLVSGMMASGQSVCAIAYLVSISDEDKRTRNITLLSAIASLCTAFGFLIGGIIGDFNIKYSFLTQVISLCIMSLIFKLFINERQKTKEITKISILQLAKDANPFKSFMIAKNIMTKKLFIFLSLTFICFFSSTSYDNAFNYYVKDILDFPPSYNGAIKFSIGIIGLIVNCTLNIYISKRYNLNKVVPTILFICSGGLLLVYLSTSNIYFLLFNMLFYVFSIMYVPHLQSIVISKEFGQSIGVLSGIYNSSKGLGMIIGGLVVGFVYDFDSKLPFLMCAILFFIATLLGLYNIIKGKSNG